MTLLPQPYYRLVWGSTNPPKCVRFAAKVIKTYLRNLQEFICSYKFVSEQLFAGIRPFKKLQIVFEVKLPISVELLINFLILKRTFFKYSVQ